MHHLRDATSQLFQDCVLASGESCTPVGLGCRGDGVEAELQAHGTGDAGLAAAQACSAPSAGAPAPAQHAPLLLGSCVRRSILGAHCAARAVWAYCDIHALYNAERDGFIPLSAPEDVLGMPC